MTNFKVNSQGGAEVRLVFQDDAVNCEHLKYFMDLGLFKAEKGETYFVPQAIHKDRDHILVGMGKRSELCSDDLRLAGFKACQKAHELKLTELELSLEKYDNMCLRTSSQAFCEGAMRADYSFDQYKSKKADYPDVSFNLLLPAEKAGKADKIAAGIEESQIIMEGTELTQDLVNEPANVIYPETLAAQAQKELTPLGVRVEVFGRAECEKMGLQAFLSVARGSAKEPKLIVMHYEGNPNSDERLALVGKGITYDSGGYSIKPTDGMLTMHCDMGGGATVIGALYAIAKQGLKLNVVGVTAACENMLSGDSYKPGDLIGSLSGKTIEIGNTDAEGRVTLADSVYYASKVCKATKIIDIATLTGACLVALGEEYTGAVTNNQDFFDQVQAAAVRADEKIWQLPISDRFKAMNKSKKADIKNVAGRLGGSITAGLFVGEFVYNNIPWVHLDIAGTAYLSAPYGYLPEFATGVHVKTLYYLAKSFVESLYSC